MHAHVSLVVENTFLWAAADPEGSAAPTLLGAAGNGAGGAAGRGKTTPGADLCFLVKSSTFMLLPFL